jgi:glyoxylase-like metal-dependent hydrolase (beta-lactamase superfamily II)
MFSMSVTRAIDVMHQGLDRVICTYEVDGVVVDPGPSTGLETLLHGLESGEPRALLLTHIHLDHAGASGSLVARFPDLTVYVHERGAAHLADPSRLLASARRLYGDDMERLWGEVAPVPEDRMRVLTGGEVVEGFRVAYTPGHALHHVAYLHEQSGEAYVGDLAGVRIPPFDFTIAPTPPPEVDVEAWLSSLDTLAGWEPAALYLAHFGRVADVPGQLERMRSSLRRRAEAARDGDRESFLAGLRRDVRAAVDEETAVRAEQAAPPEQLWLGLERYWRKRAERGEEVVKA